MDWDLIPAPLTKLGDSCGKSGSRPAYINTATGQVPSFDEYRNLIEMFTMYVGHFSIFSRIPDGHDEHGFFMRWPTENFSEEAHRRGGVGKGDQPHGVDRLNEHSSSNAAGLRGVQCWAAFFVPTLTFLWFKQ